MQQLHKQIFQRKSMLGLRAIYPENRGWRRIHEAEFGVENCIFGLIYHFKEKPTDTTVHPAESFFFYFAFNSSLSQHSRNNEWPGLREMLEDVRGDPRKTNEKRSCESGATDGKFSCSLHRFPCGGLVKIERCQILWEFIKDFTKILFHRRRKYYVT